MFTPGEADPRVVVDVFEFLESVYYNMPMEETQSDRLDKIIASMGDDAIEFFAALTAAASLALTVMSDETRLRFFAVGESAKKDV